MADMGETELTPMVTVDPFHLPQSEPLALTVNKEKESSELDEFRQEQEEEEEEVNIKQNGDKRKTGFTFTVADNTGENQSFTLQVPRRHCLPLPSLSFLPLSSLSHFK